jgi:hypothetical protein
MTKHTLISLQFFLYFSFSINLCQAAQTETLSFSSSNLPIILIDTEGGIIKDPVRIPARMEVKYNADGSRNAVDQADEFSGRISIEIRGSSSAWFDKKSYGFETQDESGENLNVPLLGLPEENDWILYGPYSDKSLLRNAITFYLARKMGRYASRFKYCELVINGDYQGLYILMEKIKRDKNRVDIAELTPEITEGEELTGGYIIKVDKLEGEYRGWTSPAHPSVGGAGQIFFQYVYPKQEIITPVQEQYIQKYILDFENALNSTNFRDSEKGYLPFVDELSFVDMLIINELTKNIDCYRFSTFMYKDKNGPLTMGPIWDYNLGYGNVDYGSERAMYTDGWMYNESGGRMYWWLRMMQNYKFKILLSDRWFELRHWAFSTQNVNATLDSLLNHIDEAQQRNFQRWPVLGVYLWPNFFVGQTYQEEIDFLKKWMGDRLQWMDDNMPYPDKTQVQLQNDASPQLSAATPNPFTTLMVLNFQTSATSQADLRIYDVLGRHVKTLTQVVNQSGRGQATWDGTDFSGQNLPNGIYFYQISQNGIILNRGKIIKQQ